MFDKLRVQSWIYHNLLQTWLFRLLINCFYQIFGKVVWLTAKTGLGSEVCLKYGYLPMPVHFYSPVPDIEDLKQRRIWDVKSSLPGIDFNVAGQLALLEELGRGFSKECSWSLTSERPTDFVLQNSTFSYGCAASTHCMIRHFRPVTVIEIGSGLSSRVISQSLAMNRDDGHSSTYTIVDPYPGEVVRSGGLHVDALLPQRVELLAPEFFNRLAANDILFIDSSHVAKIGSDVNFLFLEVLPRLEAGVIVHIHDISLPYEYSKTYCVSAQLRQFWTEQYLLQAFLCGHRDFEVQLAMNFLMTDHPEHFKQSFPAHDRATSPNNSGSFWLRRKALTNG